MMAHESRHLATIRSHPRALVAYGRVRAVLDGRAPDRVPFFDNYWPQFRTRYLAERGLPPDTDLRERFDHDFVLMAPVMGPWPSRAAVLGHDSRGHERVLLPNLKRLVAEFHALGFKVSYESEGNTWPMLDLLDEAGVDGLAYMEPRAGMRIERVRERFGDRFFFLGNVCNVQVLPSGDRGRIARDVHRVLSSAVAGGYMGLSAHSIGTDVSPDAYEYFWGLMDRFARYPLDLDALAAAGADPQVGC